jgi:hypothetical protein
MAAANLSLLLPYLGCATHALRSALIRLLKTVLLKVLAHKVSWLVGWLIGWVVSY